MLIFHCCVSSYSQSVAQNKPLINISWVKKNEWIRHFKMKYFLMSIYCWNVIDCKVNFIFTCSCKAKGLLNFDESCCIRLWLVFKKCKLIYNASKAMQWRKDLRCQASKCVDCASLYLGSFNGYSAWNMIGVQWMLAKLIGFYYTQLIIQKLLCIFCLIIQKIDCIVTMQTESMARLSHLLMGCNLAHLIVFMFYCVVFSLWEYLFSCQIFA